MRKLKCPNCGKDGAVLLYRTFTNDHVFCNIYHAESGVPICDKNFNKKGDYFMNVSYKGYSGQLKKLELIIYRTPNNSNLYELSIYDDELGCTHNFDCVKIEDIKFLNATVSFSEKND